MTTAVVVSNRQSTRRIQALGLRCDHHEIPELTEAGAQPAYWIGGEYSFSGSAAALGEDGQTGASQQVDATGMVALAVAGDRFVAILSPAEPPHKTDAPAVWLAASLADLQIGSSGKVGLLKKRPEYIEVRCDGWELKVSQVSSLDREAKMSKPWQEGSLLRALRRGDQDMTVAMISQA